ncbi:MAG: cyclic nucleotide-binding domain-containing protein [Desulfobacterales bacterium]|jgi:CRP-like cAMP-binding protein|nr:cyclic nucleotide-binding domain-containing protein [Desulfobacterales bacterium]
MSIEIEAFVWGIVSAVSLPAGSILGMLWKPSHKTTSAFMAFGAGALLFALTIELFGKAIHHAHGNNTLIYIVIISAISGGICFDTLNQILNSKGAFLRNLSSTKRYIIKLKFLKTRKLAQQLSHIKVLSSLPPEVIARLIPLVKQVSFNTGELIFEQGDGGDALYFILSGEVDIVVSSDGKGTKVSTLKDFETFGEIALITKQPRTATAIAKTDVQVYKILNMDFSNLVNSFPKLKEQLDQLASDRLEDLEKRVPDLESKAWYQTCVQELGKQKIHVTEQEIMHETKKVMASGGTAAIAIWLGILIDGIPESVVIGTLTTSAKGMSIAFIVGVFLANFPEAMSSTVGMIKNGMSKIKAFGLWTSITLLTGIGAYIGAYISAGDKGGEISHFIYGFEGLAAGAMLTMIAETMLPEAFEQGGTIVGMMTLLGFLAALTVKVFV